MLRQNETLQTVTTHRGYEKKVRKRRDGDPLVTEYHADDYFVRTVFTCGEWHVRWYDSGARPLGDVGHYDDEETALEAAQECFKGIIEGKDDPRP